MSKETVTIYIPLLEEGGFTARPTESMMEGDNVYKVLPTPDYDPEDEIWEFLPGSIVHCKPYTCPVLGELLLAYELVR